MRKSRSTHVVAMQRGRGVANLDAKLAKLAPGATKTSLETKLPMATQRRTDHGQAPIASCGEIALAGIMRCMKAYAMDLRAKLRAKIVESVGRGISKSRAGR